MRRGGHCWFSLTMALAAMYGPAAPVSIAAQTAHVSNRVEEGNIEGAIADLERAYAFDTTEGLAALRDLSLRVLRRGLEDPDPHERCFAANALGERGDWSGVSVLEDALGSPHPDLRRAAIDGLGGIGRGRALALLNGLYRETNNLGQLMILQGLRGVRNPKAFGLLVAGLREGDPSVRLQAVEDLGLFGDEQVVPELRGLLRREDVGSSERVVVAHALLRLGDRSALPQILSALENAPSHARAASVHALGDADDEKLLPVLRRALQDPNPDVAIAAAAALTRYRSREGVPRLKSALEDGDPITRRHAGSLLEHLGYETGREVIIGALAAEDIGIRLAAIHAAGVLGDERDIEALVNLLDSNEDPIVRADVAWALGRIGDRRVLDPLVALVQEREPAVRYTAADGLARAANRLLNQTHGSGKERRERE